MSTLLMIAVAAAFFSARCLLVETMRDKAAGDHLLALLRRHKKT